MGMQVFLSSGSKSTWARSKEEGSVIIIIPVLQMKKQKLKEVMCSELHTEKAVDLGLIPGREMQ